MFLVGFAVSVSVALGYNHGGRLTSNSIALWGHAWPDHARLHTWLHHTWLHTGLHHGLLHARLHHTWLHAGLHHGLLHAGLHHTWLHTWLHHTWLHHAWLHHAWLHTWLHHTWLHHTWLHSRLHHTWLHHWLHAWLHHARLHHTRLHHAWLHHTWLHARLHHAWLHLLACGSCATSALTCWLPDSFQMNLTGRFTLVLNRKPVIDSVVDAEGGKFDSSLANFIIGTGVLIEALNRQIVSDILHINVEGLVPNGRLTSSILDSSLEVLLAR